MLFVLTTRPRLARGYRYSLWITPSTMSNLSAIVNSIYIHNYFQTFETPCAIGLFLIYTFIIEGKIHVPTSVRFGLRPHSPPLSTLSLTDFTLLPPTPTLPPKISPWLYLKQCREKSPPVKKV